MEKEHISFESMQENEMQIAKIYMVYNKISLFIHSKNLSYRVYKGVFKLCNN